MSDNGIYENKLEGQNGRLRMKNAMLLKKLYAAKEGLESAQTFCRAIQNRIESGHIPHICDNLAMLHSTLATRDIIDGALALISKLEAK